MKQKKYYWTLTMLLLFACVSSDLKKALQVTVQNNLSVYSIGPDSYEIQDCSVYGNNKETHGGFLYEARTLIQKEYGEGESPTLAHCDVQFTLEDHPQPGSRTIQKTRLYYIWLRSKNHWQLVWRNPLDAKT